MPPESVIPRPLKGEGALIPLDELAIFLPGEAEFVTRAVPDLERAVIGRERPAVRVHVDAPADLRPLGDDARLDGPDGLPVVVLPLSQPLEQRDHDPADEEDEDRDDEE